MQIENPIILLFLLAIPPYIYIYFKSKKSKISKYKEFSAVNFISFYKFPKYKQHLGFLFSLLSLIALIISISNPKIEGSIVSEEKVLILLLDVSKSMGADDVAPTRFEAALETTNKFLDTVPQGYKVGLITFSEISNILSKPTNDIELVRSKLKNLELQNGTSTGDSLILALSQFGENSKGGVVVVISDGRQTSGVTTIENASGALLGAGVKAYTIALGSPEGKIVVSEGEGQEINTKVILVPPDPEGMSTIATITGGETYTAFTMDDLSTIYKSVSGKLDITPGWVSISWIVALLALFFALISAIFWRIYLIN
jgi:Ca-activated chloride channel family protein